MAKIVVEIDTASKTFKATRDGSEIDPKSVNVGCHRFYDDTKGYWASYTVEEDGMDVTHHISFEGDEKSNASEHITTVDVPAHAAKAVVTAVNAVKLSGILGGRDQAGVTEKSSAEEARTKDINGDDEPIEAPEYTLTKYNWKK